MGVQTFNGTLAHCRGVMGQVHARQAQAMRPNEGPAEDAVLGKKEIDEDLLDDLEEVLI